MKLTQNEVGIQHPRVAAILNNIALVLDDLTNQTAGKLFQAVLAILVEAYGKDHVDVAIVRYVLVRMTIVHDTGQIMFDFFN